MAPDVADLNNSEAKLDYQLDKLPLAGFSGFSARYVGRKLASGNLSLGNAVSVGDFAFDTVVPIKIENFELGDKVNSPDAVNLPLDLAIAILKDSQGNIKPPDVPVAGPLNDPSVSIGKLIWYAVSSLIKSIVAAPFNLLGDALGGVGGGGAGGAGGGMPAVTFAPGTAQPGPDAASNIQKLATALTDRPALGLRLVAVPAPSGADEQALRRATLRERLAAQDGGAPPTDARYAQAIAAWYAEYHPAGAGGSASGTAAPSGPSAPEATGATGAGDAVKPERRRRRLGRGGRPRWTDAAEPGSDAASGSAKAGPEGSASTSRLGHPRPDGSVGPDPGRGRSAGDRRALHPADRSSPCRAHRRGT